MIAELSQADGLDALDDLLELDLIRPTEVPRRFIFRHPLVRRAVYESTRGGWRLGAHGRAADALARARSGACRACSPHRAVRRPRGPGRDRAAARGGALRGFARAGDRGALVRGGAAAAPGHRRRTPGRGPRRACLGAAFGRRARAMPDLAPGGDGPARSRCRRAARRADRPLRGGRALAGTPRRGPPSPHPRVGRAERPRHTGGRRAADRAGPRRHVPARLRAGDRGGQGRARSLARRR